MDNIKTGKLIAELRKAKGVTIMEHSKQKNGQMTVKEKIKILFWTLAGLGIGGVVGIIAYHQQWLG